LCAGDGERGTKEAARRRLGRAGDGR
jgi:hypothetical protein